MFVNGEDSFPTEVWEICWESEVPIADLVVLSQTCRLFRDICQPLIFTRVENAPEDPSDLTEREYQTWEANAVYFESRIKWLAEHPRHSKYPQECSFYGVSDAASVNMDSIHPKASTIYHSILSTFKKFLPSFTGLRVVQINGVSINQDLLRTLKSLPLLSTLRFLDTTFVCHTNIPLLTLKDLSITMSNCRNQISSPTPSLDLFSNQLLESLDLSSVQHAPLCFRHFMRQGPCNFLTDLRAHINCAESLSTLFAFLETCPCLEGLAIESRFSPLSYPPLSASSLPRLNYFSGPATLAAIVIPLRPVTSVVFRDRDWSCSIKEVKVTLALSKILESSGKIDHLTLPCLTPHPDVFHVISNLFPDLISLDLSFKYANSNSNVIGDPDTPHGEHFSMGNYDDVIPVELNKDGNPVKPPESMKGLVDYLRTKKAPLPASIEQLSITLKIGRYNFPQLAYFMNFFSVREQRSTAIDLSTHYPTLKLLEFDMGEIMWIKENPQSHWKPGASNKAYLDDEKLTSREFAQEI